MFDPHFYFLLCECLIMLVVHDTMARVRGLKEKLGTKGSMPFVGGEVTLRKWC